MQDSSGALTENQIQRSILDYLTKSPYVVKVWRNNTGGIYRRGRYIKFGEPGIPDILGFTTLGTFFAIEVKKPKKKPTKEQADFIELVNTKTKYAHAIVAKDISDVMNLFNDEIIPLLDNLPSRF